MARQAEALAKDGRASGYRSQYSCLEGRRVSLNTYARRFEIGVPCESCTRLCGFADRCLGCSANGTKKGSNPVVQDCSGVIWPFFWKSMYKRAFPEEASLRS